MNISTIQPVENPTLFLCGGECGLPAVDLRPATEGEKGALSLDLIAGMLATNRNIPVNTVKALMVAIQEGVTHTSYTPLCVKHARLPVQDKHYPRGLLRHILLGGKCGKEGCKEIGTEKSGGDDFYCKAHMKEHLEEAKYA